MKRIIAALALALALSGCATSTMEGFIGQPVQIGVARYGPPDMVFDMPDGRRAFQWRIDSTTMMPVTTTGTSTTNLFAPPGAYASARTNYSQTTSGGQTISQTCRYTMYARWNEAGNAWIFESFEKPSLLCS